MIDPTFGVRENGILYWADVEATGHVMCWGRSPASMAMHELSKAGRVEITKSEYQSMMNVRDDSIVFLSEGTVSAKLIERSSADLRADAIRLRNVILASCDWTQAVDSPLDDDKKAAWRAYRQELRDLTKQPGFPDEDKITWPEILFRASPDTAGGR